MGFEKESSPLWGRELKSVFLLVGCNIVESSPLWGRELKLLHWFQVLVINLIVPLVGT